MDKQNRLAKLPSLDLLLQQPICKAWMQDYSPVLIKYFLRESLQQVRHQLQNKENVEINRDEIVGEILRRVGLRLQTTLKPHLQRIINSTGIILHTGLGRAPLSLAAQNKIQEVIQGYCNLEVDLETGKRGERNTHILRMICDLCGAEDAVVVNNNAAAVLLGLNTFCFGKEAIISRGQLIEIGGSFRLPEVMEKSGAIMREVGTTNKTRLQDYSKAITKKTAAIMVAHTSNYRVLGFTEETELSELAALAHKHRLPLIHDLGGGVLVDLRQFGLPYEPMVQDSIAAGADVVTFSGDKVLGGPQSGLIVGKKKFIRQIYQNPLLRALRCDKLTFAALEATLGLFFAPQTLLQQNRTLAMFCTETETLKARAEKVVAGLTSEAQTRLNAQICESKSQAGSGALPLEQIPSYAVSLRPSPGKAIALANHLRGASTPVVGYIKDECLYLDMRTVLVDEISVLINVLNDSFHNW